jgi:DNA-binding transcriptional regulator PaaX
MTRLEHIGFGKESDYLADIPSDGSKVSTSDKIYENMIEDVQYRHGDLLKIAEGLGINPNSAKVVISRMVKKGIITQIDGFYIKH